MNTKNTTVARTWFVATPLLILILSGCASLKQQTPKDEAHWQPFPDTPIATLADPAAPETPAIEHFDSVFEARDIIVHQIDERPELTPSHPKPADTVADQGIEAAVAAEETNAVNDEEIQEETQEEQISVAAEALAPPANIWDRIRSGFALVDGDHAQVRSHTQWYAKHQKYLDRTFTRARPYLHHIVEEVEKRGMPMEIVLLPVVESAFQPFAYSHGRASGIWQFIPGTGRNYGLAINWWYDGRRDIKASTHAALNYLERLHKMFDGDWLLALAAYNSGEGTVRRAVRNNLKKGKKTDFWHLKLPRETRGYVPKLLAISNIVATPDAYHVTLLDIANEPYLTSVDTGSQIDLALAAEMAGISLEQLYTLNPGFNRWATPPEGPHQLLMPLDKAELFREKLAQMPKEDRIKWVRHKIGQGETLGHIARRYKTTVSVLQRINDLHGHIIRAGKHLLIPVASRAESSYALSQEQRLQAKQNIPRGAKRTNYAVRSGDTLWDISRAYQVSIRALASWNNMAPRDTLRPGQTLVIWTNSNKASTAQLPTNTNPGLKAATRKINYRVRQGDSLARISQRFNVPVVKLKQWNPKARGKYIQPGQMLVVYIDVTQVSENI